jgi:23S rRNA (uracil1939-C5)-methyltransferase
VESINNELVDLKIISLSKRGNGVALLGRPCGASPLEIEIPFTMVGDVVKTQLLGKKGGVFYGEMQELLIAAPKRIKPACVHFGSCGGCRLQHMTYEDQLLYKDTLTKEAFASLIIEEAQFRSILRCEERWHYRNKIDYAFCEDQEGNLQLGLRNARGPFDISECHIGPTWFIEAADHVRKWWDSWNKNYGKEVGLSNTLEALTLREGMHGEDRMVILTIASGVQLELQHYKLEAFAAFLKGVIPLPAASSQISIFARIMQREKGATTTIYDMLLEGPGYIREELHVQLSGQEKTVNKFHIGPAAFFQPNTRQTERFYSAAFEMLQLSKNDIVYDLYCGIGALGISVSKYVKQVVGIELSSESVAYALGNVQYNACKNVQIICGAVRYVLRMVTQEGCEKPDIVMLNPPTSGLDTAALLHTVRACPRKILYISSNLATQTVDVAKMVQHGYRLAVVQPIDLFPHTAQFLNLAMLERI